MGNNPNENKYIWKTVEIKNNCRVLRNDDSDFQVQEYTKQCQDDQIMDILLVYRERKYPPPNVVILYAYRLERHMKYCNENTILYAYIEKLPYNLSNLFDLEENHYIYILYNALKGFNNFKCKIGNYFFVNDKLIFVNQKGEIKIWINQNLAENEPMNLPPTTSKQQQQHIMVEQTFNAVQKHARSFEFSKDFFKYIQSQMKAPYNLEEAIQIVQNYAHIKNYNLLPFLFLQKIDEQRFTKMQQKLSVKSVSMKPYSVYSQGRNFLRMPLKKKKNKTSKYIIKTQFTDKIWQRVIFLLMATKSNTNPQKWYSIITRLKV